MPRGCVPLLWPSDSRQRPFNVLASASGIGLLAGMLDTFPGLDNAGHAAIGRGPAEPLFPKLATQRGRRACRRLTPQNDLPKKVGGTSTLLRRMSLSSPDRAGSS